MATLVKPHSHIMTLNWSLDSVERTLPPLHDAIFVGQLSIEFRMPPQVRSMSDIYELRGKAGKWSNWEAVKNQLGSGMATFGQTKQSDHDLEFLLGFNTENAATFTWCYICRVVENTIWDATTSQANVWYLWVQRQSWHQWLINKDLSHFWAVYFWKVGY